MNLVLLGPPGAGKGTQARRLASLLKVPQISTGDLLRAARAERTPIGQKAERYMLEGKLVPDAIVVEIVRERLSCADCRSGYILDGFPRTVVQAESLDSSLKANGSRIDRVIRLEVDPPELVQRLAGRRQCKACGENFHLLWHASKKSGVCDRCGGALIQREDDQEEVIRKRLEVYEQETSPVIDYYRRQGKLANVAGTGGVEEVFARVAESLTKS